MNPSVSALPLTAYRIATEPGFLDDFLQLHNPPSELRTLDPDEQDALQKLLKQGWTYLLHLGPEDAPLEGYWWTSAGK